jgi:hypothetical protein
VASAAVGGGMGLTYCRPYCSLLHLSFLPVVCQLAKQYCSCQYIHLTKKVRSLTGFDSWSLHISSLFIFRITNQSSKKTKDKRE